MELGGNMPVWPMTGIPNFEKPQSATSKNANTSNLLLNNIKNYMNSQIRQCSFVWNRKPKSKNLHFIHHSEQQ